MHDRRHSCSGDLKDRDRIFHELLRGYLKVNWAEGDEARNEMEVRI